MKSFYYYSLSNECVCVCVCVQFYRCFRAFLSCSVPERGSTIKTFSRPTKTLRTARQPREHRVSAPAPSTVLPTPNAVHDSSQKASRGASSPSPSKQESAAAPAASNTPAVAPKPKLILVAHYRE